MKRQKQKTSKNVSLHVPGFEPGSERPQRSILTTRRHVPFELNFGVEKRFLYLNYRKCITEHCDTEFQLVETASEWLGQQGKRLTIEVEGMRCIVLPLLVHYRKHHVPSERWSQLRHKRYARQRRKQYSAPVEQPGREMCAYPLPR